jgi:radical SAM family uncharacterized protein
VILDWENLKRHLSKVEKPARYIGGEINSVHKKPEKVSVRFALAFPDVYEVGASHLGSQILYYVLNSREDTWCERVFAPWPDMESLLREKNWPLYTLESYTPLNDFDIVGFSLQYELTYTNVLNMLDMGRIPLHSASRGNESPLVIAGGPCAMSAEPLADFLDALVLGDGEEAVGDVVEVYKRWRASREPRIELLKRLSQIPSVYVPSLYHVSYDPSGTVSSVTPKELDGFKPPRFVERRVLDSIEKAPVPLNPVIPLIPPIHDRAMIEIFRGCTQGCRFCQSGILYRPVRERSRAEVERLVQETIERTGFDEVSLVSLSSADYSQIEEVLSDLINSPVCTKVSLPSLRIDSFSVKLADMLGQSRSGLTLAPEAGSQRMRDVINKRVTEDQIMEAVTRAYESGYSHIKLYFMIGLPGETYDDVEAIGDLAKKIRKVGRDMRKRPTVVVSVSGFVPKAHTPFQWESSDSPLELRRKQDYLKSILKGPGLEFRYHEAHMTKLEAVFARGDRRLSEALLLAFKKGCRFDSWPDMFRKDVWDEVFSTLKIDPDFYSSRLRELDELFPWDHLHSGVRKSFLLDELKKSREAAVTLDCRGARCTLCGVCPDLGVSPKTFKETDKS